MQKPYVYQGAKTDVRRELHRQLQRHHAVCLRRSNRQAQAELASASTELPQPLQPTAEKPASHSLPSYQPPPAPIFGGTPGLEAATREIEAFSRNAPLSQWPSPPTIPAQEEEKNMSVTAKLAHLRSAKNPTTPTGQIVTTPRYAAALAALQRCWEARPPAFSPGREIWEAHEHKEARAEVRAAWIEAAQLYGIDPDRK